MAAKSYGRIRWVEDYHDAVSKKAEYVVFLTENYMIQFKKLDGRSSLLLAELPSSCMSEKNYVKTLTTFRKMIKSKKTIWVEMPVWKFYRLHPELDIGFD